MNKLFLMVALFSIATSQHSFAQDSTKANQLSTLLNAYYDIKNALVSSNTIAAATKAVELVTAIDAVDMKSLSVADHKAFMAAQDNIKKDAQAIASSNKIEAQRTTFSSLSNNVYALAKSAKLSADPVYQQYCPMKKMYWLSNQSSIKNPYYGSMMLTCGKVTETLK
ncbi:MAG: DUF3347 domain-containing protein [Ferruginibacter sp.]